MRQTVLTLSVVVLGVCLATFGGHPVQYTRLGFSKGQLTAEFPNYRTPIPAPDSCNMSARQGIVFNPFEPGEKHGSLKVHRISDGAILARCPIIAFNQQFAHADCDGDGIEPSDLTIERVSGSMLRMTNIQAVLGSTIPAGVCFDFSAFKGFSLTPPAEVEMDFSDNGSTGTVYKYLGLPLGPFAVTGRVGDLEVGYRAYTFNPSGVGINVGYRFRDQGGSPTSVKVGSQTGDTFSWSVGPGQSRGWDIQSLSGSLKMFSIEPVPVSGNMGPVYGAAYAGQFRTHQLEAENGSLLPAQTNSDVVGDAGLAYSQVGLLHTVAVKKTADGEDTAVAILNATTASGTVTLELRDQDNEVVFQETIELGAWNFIARFFLEYFDQQATSSFEGSLVIMGNVDTAIVPFNTINGFQTSSLPIGTLLP